MNHEERRLKAVEVALQLGHAYHQGDRGKIIELAEDIDTFALKGKPEDPKPDEPAPQAAPKPKRRGGRDKNPPPSFQA